MDNNDNAVALNVLKYVYEILHGIEYNDVNQIVANIAMAEHELSMLKYIVLKNASNKAYE